jgi:hypothetical protein
LSGQGRTYQESKSQSKAEVFHVELFPFRSDQLTLTLGSPSAGRAMARKVSPERPQVKPAGRPDVPGLTSFAVGHFSLNGVTSETALPS